MKVLIILVILKLVLASPNDRSSYERKNSLNQFQKSLECIDRFCPPGTYCEVLTKVVQCKSPPCRPIIACLPENVNGKFFGNS